jgi:hypothetical protein
MAAIDSLLALVDAQQATGIVLRAREAPVMIGGKGRGLTMPPMSPLTLETFVGEVLSQEELSTLNASGACDAVYRAGQAGTFSVEARKNGDNLSLKLRRGAAGVAKPAVAPVQAAPPPAAPDTASETTTVASPDPVVDPAQAALASRLAATIARATSPEVSDVVVSSGQPLWIRTAAGFSPASANPMGEAEIRAFVDSLLDGRRR